MSPGVRKLALTAHVVSSVAWLGSVAVFLALAIAGLINGDAQMVRADYLVMESISWWVIVPLCLASLLTGVVSSLGTPLGLFRQYWILIKLLITMVATLVLFVHMQPITLATRIAAHGFVGERHIGLQVQLLVASAAALIVLVVTTALSVYKPRGLTRYGWRKQYELGPTSPP